MNIQISVAIWTVICFVLLMVILRNLLFKPVLKVMDDRKKRIEKATAKKEQLLTQQAEHEQMALEKKQQLLKQHKEQVKKETEQIQVDGKRAIEKAREKRIADVELYRKMSNEQHDAILSVLSNNTKDIAKTFADRIICQ